MWHTPLRNLRPRVSGHDSDSESEPMLETGEIHLQQNSATTATSAPHYRVLYCVYIALIAWAIVRETPWLDRKSYRTLAIYFYTNSSSDYENARFLIEHGYHTHMDWIFVQRGDGSLRHLITGLPRAQYAQVAADCRGWAAVQDILRPRQRHHPSFLFITSSLRGPFLPYWAHTSTCWSHEYLSRLSSYTKLVGMTYSCEGSSHVQPHLFATDSHGLALLLESPFFGKCAATDAEDLLLAAQASAIIRDHGFGEDVMMNGYHQSSTYSAECTQGDPMSGPESYFGFDLHPMETFFVRPGGGWTDIGLAQYTQWTDSVGWNAHEPCRMVYNA